MPEQDAVVAITSGTLVLDREYNVALGDAPTRRPQLVGQAAFVSNTVGKY
jgi:hypothetical protein